MYGLKKVRNRRDDALSRVSWQDFERLLATYYRGQGYEVDHVGTGAASTRFDGGIDLKLRRDDAFVLVQCKHWNARQVTHNAVHELLGISVNQGATGAVLITSGEFTRAAIEAAQKQGHVQLVDGDALRAMVGPLPEPELPSSSFSTADHDRLSPTRDPRSAPARPGEAPHGLGHQVASRLLSAAEDRIRYGKGGARRQERTSNGALIKLIGGLLAMGLFLVFLQTVAANLMHSLSGIGQPRAQVVVPALSAPGSTPGAITAMPEVAVVETASSTPPAPQISHEMSPAELREWKRRNAESMKVLEATTPEM